MSGTTTLKSYFLTGSSPTEAQFADLIDSVLVLSEDLSDSLTSDSSVTALSSSGAKSLSDSLASLTSRVVILEGEDSSFAANYYTKTEIDSQISIVSELFNTLPYTAQISQINSELDALQTEVDGLASMGHIHAISAVTGLQDALDLKATRVYVDNIAELLTQSINAIVPGSDESDEVEQLQNYVDAINSVVELLPTQSDFENKADVGHQHTISDISDIGSSYYNKSETDTLLANVEPRAHTHVEAEIVDLDKYTQAATDLKIGDHSNRLDNPHSVTKAQVGLDNVENLSVPEIFQSSEASLLATKAELEALDAGSNLHTSNQSNPHNVTKVQIGLGDVPNINFQSLLDAHLAEDNPHGIDLSFFDVYTTGETDNRIQFYIDAFRYNFTPSSASDGAGAIGDYAWDGNNFYLKTGSAKWETIKFLRTNASGQTVFNSPILAEDGLVIGTTGDAANLVVNGGSTITGTLSAGVTTVTSLSAGTGSITGGTTTVSSLSAGSGTITTTGTLSAGGATVTSLNAGAGTITTTGTLSTGGATVTSLNAGSGTIQGGTITGTSLSAGTGAISGGATTVSSLNAGTGAIETTGTLSAGGATVTSLNAGSGAISTTGTISGGATTVSSLSTTGSASVGSLTSAGALSGTNLTLSGNLTVKGTTTNIDTTNLVIEDNIVLLNKNQTGTPAGTLKSGFEVERGTSTNVKFFWDESDDKWKADIGGTIKTVAFTDTAPASHTHPLSAITDSGTAAGLDVATSGNASSAQVVKGNDTRLTNSRTPTSHTHGNITNTGKIGSAANLPVITTTGGAVTTGSFGTGVNTFCQGNDSRLSDARTPTAHTHDSRYARHDASQTLTNAQKTQIRGNIGAAASADVGLTQAQVEELLYSK